MSNNHFLRQYTDNPFQAEFEGEVRPAARFIRRKKIERGVVSEDDDLRRNFIASGDSDSSSASDLNEFEPNLPEKKQNKRKRVFKSKKPPKQRTSNPVDEDLLQAKRDAKKQLENERNAQILSALYVVDTDTDEEADATFFAREAAQRERNQMRTLSLIESDMTQTMPSPSAAVVATSPPRTLQQLPKAARTYGRQPIPPSDSPPEDITRTISDENSDRDDQHDTEPVPPIPRKRRIIDSDSSD